MENETNEHEKRMKRTAEVFYNNKWIAHIKTYEGKFYNGRIFDLFNDYLEVHDRVLGRTKLLYVDIKKIVEYVNEGGSQNAA